MSVNSNITRQEITQHIHSFSNDVHNMTRLAHEYEMPMPSWAVCTLIERTTGIFSRIFCLNPNSNVTHNSQLCGVFSRALIEQNMFKQKYRKQLTSFEELRSALQDNEEGLFLLSHKCIVPVYADKKGYAVFPGSHGMVLIKFFENNQPKYRVAQIFIGEYTLDEFIKKHEENFLFESFEELETQFLEPLKIIFYHTDRWEQEEENAYYKLTKAWRGLIGNPEPYNKESAEPVPRWKVERTTNYGLPSCSSILHLISTIGAATLFLLGAQLYLESTESTL